MSTEELNFKKEVDKLKDETQSTFDICEKVVKNQALFAEKIECFFEAWAKRDSAHICLRLVRDAQTIRDQILSDLGGMRVRSELMRCQLQNIAKNAEEIQKKRRKHVLWHKFKTWLYRIFCALWIGLAATVAMLEVFHPVGAIADIALEAGTAIAHLAANLCKKMAGSEFIKKFSEFQTDLLTWISRS